VIEVTGSHDVTSRGHMVRVVVRAEMRRRRHVVLLLRLHNRVTSYVRTESLRGTLDIVVSLSILIIDLVIKIILKQTFIYSHLQENHDSSGLQIEVVYRIA